LEWRDLAAEDALHSGERLEADHRCARAHHEGDAEGPVDDEGRTGEGSDQAEVTAAEGCADIAAAASAAAAAPREGFERNGSVAQRPHRQALRPVATPLRRRSSSSASRSASPACSRTTTSPWPYAAGRFTACWARTVPASRR